MPTYTTSQRKGALLGPTIAIKGTSIVVNITDHSLNYITPIREVTRVHDSTAASSDKEPAFVTSTHVKAYVRCRGYVTKATGLLAALKLNTSIAVTVSIGGTTLDGSLLLQDASHTTGKKSRFIRVALGGTFTGSKAEAAR